MSEKQPADKSPEPAPASIKPLRKKIGEKPGNLRAREAWYQRRAGGREKLSSREG